MNSRNYKNWKLKEIEGQFEVISANSIEFIEKILSELNLPTPSEENNGLYSEDTHIDWNKMPTYFNLFFDLEKSEDKVAHMLSNSKISKYENIIITYGWNEPVIKVSTGIFIADWEGFIRSTLWETIIFSNDYKLIMEVSRDYNLHSNFEIKTGNGSNS